MGGLWWELERLGGDFKDVSFVMGLLDEFIVWEGGFRKIYL